MCRIEEGIRLPTKGVASKDMATESSPWLSLAAPANKWVRSVSVARAFTAVANNIAVRNKAFLAAMEWG